MNDALASRHPVDLARTNRLHVTKAVPMQYLTLEQKRDGGEADMRMRANVHTGAGRKLSGPHVIEKDERPHTLPALVWQRTAHREFTQVLSPRA